MAALRAAGGAAAVTNQLPYNPLWRAIESAAQPACVQQGLAILYYSPLQQGLLSGKFRAADDVADGRRRTRLFGPSGSDKRCVRGGGGREAT